MCACVRNLILIGASLANVVGASEPPTLRVLTYNIHHGEGTDGRLDLPRIAKIIQQAHADIVMLQEVDRAVERSGGVDQVTVLARRTNLYATFGPNLSLQGGQYGNAILARWPARNSRNVLLPSFAEGEQRGMLVADVAWPATGQTLRLIATHWDHRRDATERLASADRLNQFAREDGTLPIVLGGDLNATPDSRELQRLRTLWLPVGNPPLATIPVEAPTRQIDFVLVRPQDNWEVLEVAVLDERVASDHRPLLAVLRPRTTWPQARRGSPTTRDASGEDRPEDSH